MKLSISMSRLERLLGWCYMLLSVFVLPIALSLINVYLANPLSATVLNLIYFGLNFVCVAAIFHRFLWNSVKAVAAKPWQCLRFAVAGFALYYLSFTLLNMVINWLNPQFSNVNDQAISVLAQEYRWLMTLATVLLVPVAEETFYRGLIFQGLHSKNRVLAYVISMILFGSIHIIGYVGLYDAGTLFLCFLQYLPAAFCLAWAYEKSDTIATPIVIHMFINLIGVLAMR